MAKKKQPQTGTPEIENRKARFDYHIEETLEVGLILRGSEVKSVRKGEVSLGEGYVLARAEPPELTLIGVNIGEYAPSGALGHRPTRARPLLAHKREIIKLARTVEAKGLTIVPLKLYFKEGWAKLLIGIARGKQAHDKRDTIAKREAKRDIDRAMSKRR
jgi:SsrA-binding protein